MPQKKKAPAPPERHPTNLRFSDEEIAPLEADRKEINAAGVPVSFGQYAKHAVKSYPRLRRLEAMLREAAVDAQKNGSSADSESIFAKLLLEGL